ncbi:hypothetical protein MKQ68_24750 [Chitinophaga horti]|uniref:Uncharacterized protein n=1 Tax=Chitinophaga horti TaxID=2920382 RepID=A0ABY6J0V8_9BACT|nr:hypothetical protein [Chitinophaga horti]UYQ93297.1 hypothetical protein MKQ68_24750 [Chitinophaga horti]
MMNKTLIGSAALMLAVFTSCQQGGKTADKDTTVTTATAPVDSVKLLEDEVMNIHNEGMAGTIRIRSLKKELDSAITANKKAGKETAAFVTAQAGLDSANTAMNDWMHAYDMDMEGKDEAQKKAYLLSEHTKVKAVEYKINTAIDDALIVLNGSKK